MPSNSIEFRRFRHETVDSTNECAFRSLVAGSARHGDVHIARGQRAGRGRLGRHWESAPDEGLYLSLISLPAAPIPAPLLTMAAGLALLDAVTSLGLVAGRLRWPNDLMVAAAKLGGILVETRGLDPAQPHYVIGIGLNVRQKHFSAELSSERETTSLALQGLDCAIVATCDALLPALAGRLGQIDGERGGLLDDFGRAAGLTDASVRIVSANRAHDGRVLALSLERGLELLQADGTRLRLPLEFIRSIEPLPAG